MGILYPRREVRAGENEASMCVCVSVIVVLYITAVFSSAHCEASKRLIYLEP